MSNPNIPKLKKKATDFEQKKQFDRALSLYIQLLEEAGRDLDDADLQLYNRVGDLLQRQGNVSEALAYYEKAVDVYAERGFLNNAIALCNKVLRQSPARTSVYYKLGKISATKGFKSDAKKNFLEYAERMQKSGHVDEAFRALKEFADLCPDQDDIRLMLADWLQKENRKSEAVEQLETLYIKLEEEGREAEARATIDRIKAIDPAVVPRASGSFQSVKSNDLVFLDLDDAEPLPPRHAPPAAPEAPPVPPASPRVAALDGLILTFHPDDEEDAPTSAPAAIDGFESTAAPEEAASEPLASLVADFEPLATAASGDEEAIPSLLTMEAESWSEPGDPVPHVDGLEGARTSLVGAHPAMAPLLDAPPMSGEEFGELALSRHDDAPRTAPSSRSAHDLALPSDLPVLPSDGSIDLLRVMGTPLGSPAIVDPDEARAAADIDLLSLPPVGDSLGHASSLEWPVTGSDTPLQVGADTAPDDADAAETRDDASDPTGVDAYADAHADAHAENRLGDDAAADADVPVAEPSIDARADAASARRDHAAPLGSREGRDTSELVALDGSARTTDELLVVPSEEIDEETRRSLRLEFALDGDETPDAWVEAAMRATDDRSLDILLTPLYVPAIEEPAAATDISAIESAMADANAFAADESFEAPAEGEHARQESGPTWESESGRASDDDDATAPVANESDAPSWAGEGAGAEEAAHDPTDAHAAHAPASDASHTADEAPHSAEETSTGETLEEAFARLSTDAGRLAATGAEPWASGAHATAHESEIGADGQEALVSDAGAGDELRLAEVDVGPSPSEELTTAAATTETWRGSDSSLEPSPDDAEGIAADEWAATSTTAAPPSDDASVTGAADAAAPRLGDEADAAESGVVAADGHSSAVQRPDVETLELLAIPEAIGEGAPALLGESLGDGAMPHAEFDLLDELLPPFMRHDGAATRAADVAEREALADSEVRRAIDAGEMDAPEAGSALDVDALRALMLDRGSEGSGALAHAAPFDDPALASAFREQDVELPLLDVDDLLSDGHDDYHAPLDLSDVGSDDILGTPPTFGEGSTQDFLPEPLFSADDEPASEATSASALPAQTPDAETPDDWPQDAAPEVLIDGEWHDEHMGNLVSGEITAIRDGDQPPRVTPRWDDLAAALLWPPTDDGAAGDATGDEPVDDAARPTGHGTGSTTPRGSFLERLQTPRSTLSFGGVEAQLRRRLELDPANLVLRRQLGEALLDLGNRDEGLLELDLAMAGFEQAGDLESARGVADLVLRADPASVRHHQKRVEYAVRSNDRVRLVEAYVELADSLFRSGEPEKARVVYSRVLELSPGNGRARFALGLLSPDEQAARSDRIATPPELPPLPPTPADMVSLFDKAIPRTPATTLNSISAEIPVIADGIFLPRDEPVEEAGPFSDAPQDFAVEDVVAAERRAGEAEFAGDVASDASAPSAVDDPSGHGSDEFAPDVASHGPADPSSDGATFARPEEGEDVSADRRENELRDDRWATPTPSANAAHLVGDERTPDTPRSPSPLGVAALDDGSGVASTPVEGASAPDGRAAWAEHARVATNGDGADAGAELSEEESDDDLDGATEPFPAPTLDDQIEAAFAVPALVELERPVVDEAYGEALEQHDISVAPPLGAAAFATPFAAPVPSSPSLTPIGLATVGATPPVVRAIPQVPVTVRAAEPPPVASVSGSDDDFVDLGSWLRDDEPVRSTRMVTSEAPPSGDEQADFDEMLRRFKQGVAANVEEEDYASHYDLGVAYKEMGLVDEAIAEFQKSLRGESHRVRSYEALGQCFVEKGQMQVAVTLLRRALETTGADDQQLVGVLYLLGYASEVMARHADAVSYYQRVFAVDIEFRDVAQRVAALEQKTQ